MALHVHIGFTESRKNRKCAQLQKLESAVLEAPAFDRKFGTDMKVLCVTLYAILGPQCVIEILGTREVGTDLDRCHPQARVR